jgi:hypothetical protein
MVKRQDIQPPIFAFQATTRHGKNTLSERHSLHLPQAVTTNHQSRINMGREGFRPFKDKQLRKA